MKCPCEGCISFAICYNKEIVECDILWKYLMGNFNHMSNCYTLCLFKAYSMKLILIHDSIKFIRDKSEIEKTLHKKYYPFPRHTMFRYRRIVRFWMYRVIIVWLNCRNWLSKHMKREKLYE